MKTKEIEDFRAKVLACEEIVVELANSYSSIDDKFNSLGKCVAQIVMNISHLKVEIDYLRNKNNK